MSEELKACPICGGEVEYKTDGPSIGIFHKHKSCGLNFGFLVSDIEPFIDAWNTRAEPDIVVRAREMIEKNREFYIESTPGSLTYNHHASVIGALVLLLEDSGYPLTEAVFDRGFQRNQNNEGDLVDNS